MDIITIEVLKFRIRKLRWQAVFARDRRRVEICDKALADDNIVERIYNKLIERSSF